jgi:hypothetical protein
MMGPARCAAVKSASTASAPVLRSAIVMWLLKACPAPDLGREAALERFHVRLAGGELVSGAAAFLALWRETPGFRYLAMALSPRPVVAVLDVAYEGFLKLRRLWR